MKTPLLALLLVSAASAHAAEPGRLSLDFTNDLLFQRDFLSTAQGTALSGERGAVPKANQFQETFSVFGNYQFEGDGGSLSGGLTLRDVNFYKEQGNTTLNTPDTSLYRKYLRYTAKGFCAQAGDFNTILGRGLVLSVVQNDLILKDWTILGADAQYQGDRWSLHALDGVVSNNMPHLDHGNRPIYNLFEKWDVLGAEGTFEFLKDNRAGYHVSRIDDRDLSVVSGYPMGNVYSKGRRLTQSFSLAGDNLGGFLNYYLEAANLKFEDPGTGWRNAFPNLEPDKGKGTYGNVAFHQGTLYLMAEYKRYEHFDNELNNPPLADRDTELVNKDDSSGQRFYAQYSFAEPDLTVFACAGRYIEGKLSLRDHYSGGNVYGGFKLEDWHDRISASYTYGLKTVHTYPNIGNFPEKRSDASCTYKFTPVWSLDFSLKDWRRSQVGQDPWQQSDYQIQLAHSPRWAVFYTHQFVSYVNTTENPYNTHHLYSGGLRVNLKKGSFIELSGGKMHGGEVCSGGQCVQMPAFKGWKINTHFRF